MADRSPLSLATAPASDQDPAGWAELHVHSGFSFLQGACAPDELVAEAARLGIEVLALTDRDSLAGAQRLAQAARTYRLATVYGAELSLHDHQLGPVVVIARSLNGYAQLSQVISTAQLAGRKGAPRYNLSQLSTAAATGHWAVFTGCTDPADPDATVIEHIVRRLTALQEVFGTAVHAELIDHHLPTDSIRNDALYVAARRTGTPVVATNAVHYAAPRHARLAQALTALRRRENLDQAAAHLNAAPTAHLRRPAEMSTLLARYPGVHATTLALGRDSVLDLAELRPQLPGFPVPDGHTEHSWLCELAERGTTARYGPRASPAARAAWRQLDHELTVIGELGMDGYFLIVADIVDFARRSDIWCQGRGSAANSVVCFVLGITNVDAVQHELLFERFLSTARTSPPDIDVDFEHRRRDEIFDYIWETYTRAHAAQVANIITFQPRLAVREAARALGYPTGQIDQMTRHIHHEPPAPDAAIPVDVRELAAQLHGLPRHLGVHTGGMVLTRQPLAQIMPMEWATAEGRTVLQGDKEDIENAGLVKIDILSLGMLSALHDACRLIEKHHGATYDLASIPPDNSAVYDMICRAQTVGCFQIESRAMMSTLPRLKPRTFADLVVAVSIIRPGPIQGGSVRPYLRRRAGTEPVTYPHPLAEQALRRTLGVPLFQEQMLRLAIDCAGVPPAEADQIRKALSAKNAPERVATWRQRLMTGMAQQGIPPTAAEEIYDMIASFSGYGFPESHATSMAHLVYASAWLKYHYPAAFTAALLINQPMGFYAPLTLIGDARRRGITVRPVDLAASGVHATLEQDASTTGQPAIRLGLSTIRGLSPETAGQIVNARPYSSAEDFARRVNLPVHTLEALATAGAFDCFGLDRRAALWQAGALANLDDTSLPGNAQGSDAPRLPAMGPVEVTFSDLWATGSSPDSHPVQHLREYLQGCGAATTAGLRTYADRQPALLGGLVTHRQRPPTAKGTCFLSIEDEAGLANVIVPPPVWDRYARIATEHAGLLIHGSIERSQGVVNLVAHRIAPLRLSLPTRRRR
ncbi:error-prone DNA polymerase [Streptomyces sp. NPDC004647]|uniref:error-prone DNA polymerase n=1 Tax=Streptomyces sp. NPDC004647 TaxID=3154671 RepID=UPI0033B552AA